MTVQEFFHKEQKKPKKEFVYWVKVDGEDVPTSQTFWQQMMAMGCRVDRAISWAVFATIIALVAIVIAITAIVL